MRKLIFLLCGIVALLGGFLLYHEDPTGHDLMLISAFVAFLFVNIYD